MRPTLPPAWRELLRGAARDPWQLAAIGVALAGGAWLLSPAATAERIRDKHQRIVGRPPNATGRALGLTAGQLADPVQDPIEVLAMRAAVARAGTPAPEYRGGAADFFRPYHRAPWHPRTPLPVANYNLLAAQRPFRGRPIQAGPGVAITAADVLNPPGSATNG